MSRNLYWTATKHVAHYALPISLTNLFSMSVLFFVTMMLSTLGPIELAAMAIANTTYMTISAFLNSCLYSTSILIGEHHAAGNKEAVAGYIWNSIWLSILLGLFGTLLLWYGDKFLLLIGQSAELVSYTTGYFHLSALSMLPLLLSSAIGQTYNGLGKPLVGMVVIGIRFPIILYFCYELILGHYHWGLTGAAAGFLATQIIVIIMAIIYTRYSNIWFYFQIDINRWDKAKIKQLFTIGIHVGLQFLGELSAASMGTFFMGYLGDMPLASSQIVSQYNILLIMIILGVSQAVSIRVSEARGRNEHHWIKLYTYAAIYILLFMVCLFAAVYVLASSSFLSPFIDIHNLDNIPLIQLSRQLMLISIILLLADSVKNVLTSSLRGLQNSRNPMLIGIISLWFVSVPLAYLVGIFYHGGPAMLRLSFCSGYILSAIILWFYFRAISRNYEI